MAYTKTDAGSGLDNVFDNSYVTKNELYAILDQLKEDSKFYELEVFEVVEILENPAEIVGRYVFSEQGDSIDEIEGRTFLPLNSNILQYPLRGELWLGMEYKGNHFYLSRLSEDITNVNFSKFNESTRVEEITTDLSRGENFIDIKPLHAPTQIGDTLVQGRFNNYLKLGNTDNVGTIEISNDSSLLEMTNEGNLNIRADKKVFIRGLGGVDIKNLSGGVNLIAEELTRDYIGGLTKDFNQDLSDPDKVLLPKQSIELAKQMEPFITYIKGEIQAMAYLLLPPTLPGGIPNPSFMLGMKIKFETLQKLIKKIKEFNLLEFLPKFDFETISLSEFREALGLDGLSIDFPTDEWDKFYDDIDGLKQKVLDIQNDIEVKASSIKALGDAFDVVQQGGGSTETITEALNAYESDPNNTPIDTTDIRAVINTEGVDRDDIQRYLEQGGSPQVQEAIQKASTQKDEAEQLNQIVKIIELTKQ